jgi:hypothetical protein
VKLRFSWDEPFEELVPGCRGGPVMSDGVHILACLLTDDGGLPLDHTLRVLDEGLGLIARLKSGGAHSADWARETWGARLTKDEATLYCLQQEGYSLVVGIDALDRALVAWRRFIQSEPARGASEEIDLTV